MSDKEMNTQQNQNDARLSGQNAAGSALTAVKAAGVSLPFTSAVWSLVDVEKAHVSVYSDDIHDSVVVDAEWLREAAGEENGNEARVFATVLDAEVAGWRDFDLLYIHLQ